MYTTPTIRVEGSYRKRKFVIVGFVVVILLLLSLVVGINLVGKRTSFFGRAYDMSGGEDIEFVNSYVFASPLKASVGGERIRLTVFLLDGTGRGVKGKRVNVGGLEAGLVFVSVQPITDELGKAVFDVWATKAGAYVVETSVDNVVLAQRVAITFE